MRIACQTSLQMTEHDSVRFRTSGSIRVVGSHGTARSKSQARLGQRALTRQIAKIRAWFGPQARTQAQMRARRSVVRSLLRFLHAGTPAGLGACIQHDRKIAQVSTAASEVRTSSHQALKRGYGRRVDTLAEDQCRDARRVCTDQPRASGTVLNRLLPRTRTMRPMAAARTPRSTVNLAWGSCAAGAEDPSLPPSASTPTPGTLAPA
jgi:hypothetical protein